MSNKWKALLIISLVFNIAVASALVYGYIIHSRYDGRPSFPGNGMPGRMRGMNLARRMRLPEEKMSSMGNIFDELHKEAAGLRDSLRTARAELVDLLHAEQPDEAAVMGKIDEISVLQGDMEKMLVRRLLRVQEILSPEERERFFELLQGRMQPGLHRGMGKRGHRPGRTGGKR